MRPGMVISGPMKIMIKKTKPAFIRSVSQTIGFSNKSNPYSYGVELKKYPRHFKYTYSRTMLIVAYRQIRSVIYSILTWKELL